MAQLNYPHPPDGCQLGERVVFNALRRLLPDDYFVWFEPTLFGQRHSSRPDFVVLGRDIGLVIIEVKDWSLDAILAANRDNSTHEIIDVALEAIRDSRTLLEDLQSAGDSLVEPERDHREIRHGPLPILLTFEAVDKEYEGIAKEISGLLRQGYLPKDIVILQRHHSGRHTMLAALARRNIPTVVVDGKLDLSQDSVKLSTLHSAKGLEFEIVFICGLEAFTVDKPVETGSLEFQHLLDQERKLLYVGMTRARQKLYITYSEVSPNWIVRRLEHKLAAMHPSQ